MPPIRETRAPAPARRAGSGVPGEPSGQRRGVTAVGVGPYLGIDPGSGGGIVLVAGDGLKVLNKVALEKLTLRDLLDLLRGVKVSWPGVRAGMEVVTGYAPGKKRGPNSNPGSSMFKFGVGVGHLEMALTAADIPWEKVSPQRWQKAVGVSGKKAGETDTAWKRRLKERAQALYPGEVVTNWSADALLIAEWVRRSERGEKV
jgi:hypothetical protein